MLDISNLRMEYGGDTATHLAVDNVSLKVEAGEFFTLLGPSGCGKTTTLRSVAGLETPNGGDIRIGGQPVFSAVGGINVPTQKRDISMVFQSYAIWPHMTVFQNVAFPLQAAGERKDAIRSKVENALHLVGLAEYADRSATQLSGGQQQRVALARAFVKEASILLLDEPLSNLDAKLREQMRHEMRDLQQRVGTTAIYVTHDQDEALAMSDRIAVMKGGHVIEVGTPLELYLQPTHPFTANFIGQADLIACTPMTRSGDEVLVRTVFGDVLAGVHPHLEKEATHILLRPECIQLVHKGGGTNVFPGTVRSMSFSGKSIEYRIELPGGHLLPVQAAPIEILEPGTAVHVHIPPARCVLLSEGKTGLTIPTSHAA